MTTYCQKDVILSKRPQKRHVGGGGGVWLGIKEKGPKGMGVVCLVGWL